MCVARVNYHVCVKMTNVMLLSLRLDIKLLPTLSTAKAVSVCVCVSLRECVYLSQCLGQHSVCVSHTLCVCLLPVPLCVHTLSHTHTHTQHDRITMSQCREVCVCAVPNVCVRVSSDCVITFSNEATHLKD